MNYSIDQNACVCSGYCVGIAPDYFAIKGQTAVTLRLEVAPDDEALIEEAETLCPSAAIEVKP